MQHVAATASNLMKSWMDEDDREQKEEKEKKLLFLLFIQGFVHQGLEWKLFSSLEWYPRPLNEYQRLGVQGIQQKPSSGVQLIAIIERHADCGILCPQFLADQAKVSA